MQGVCSGPAGIDGGCASQVDWACQPTQFCKMKGCTNRLGDGGTCTGDNQCLFPETCNSGICGVKCGL